ncbi:FMN-dependent NADPH-azoreductase [Roseovarius litorisediminis]|uniref:FMN-dependent NADPH-azoreductase n=1 Tax=Roseovarius litorisediminis TaxID=1312363 RepID=A0A1Y5SQ19_9RHOB|nr:NADPH-dependent FMN reductase [Roseovarius litorisediminis]SLN45770.1 FMN-dependent NADPH-azoreductase [Roseovarius litorisediminis]
MTKPTLLAISGSLRKGSFNRMLMHEAARAFGDAEVLVADLNMPLYDGDLEESKGIPAQVQALADQISAADAVLISSPEYNKGIPGVLKNALDWVSRVPGAVLNGKPTVVVSAAAGRTGGETAQFMVLSCLTQLQVRLMPGPSVLVAAASNEFDENGNLKNELYKKTLTTRMQALRAEVVPT